MKKLGIIAKIKAKKVKSNKKLLAEITAKRDILIEERKAENENLKNQIPKYN